MPSFWGAGPSMQQPDQPGGQTQGGSMFSIVDEYRNRYNPYVMSTGQDPITGTDKPADLQTFVEWRKRNPGPWN